MTTTLQKIEAILTSEYSIASYLELVQEIFDSLRIVSPNTLRKEFSNFSSHIEGYSHVGDYISPDGKKIVVLSVQLKKEVYVERSRSTQRNYAKKLIESGNCDAAVVAFYTADDPKWRLSFVRLDYKMKIDNGKLKTAENLTPAKRYSYLVGKDEPCHTAIDRFKQFIVVNNSSPTLDELEEAFSVEKVTKEFYELYSEKFHQLREHLESNSDFVEEAKRCGFTSEQFAKKLMGQIVFLYFLQKKGWLGVGVWPQQLTEKEYKDVYFIGGAHGRIIKEHLPNIYVMQQNGIYKLNIVAFDMIAYDEEEVIAGHMKQSKRWGDGSQKFLRTLFEYSKTHKQHFFENYLEPLFYDTLNRNRGTMGYCPAFHCRIPFLSGGLFEPLDGYDWKSNNFDILDEMFSTRKDEEDRNGEGILDVFDRYNFTMSEDEPMEREVAIDPEMLGKVFENLLEVKDRKSKGAFYTPREIVHYMCKESLIYYLIKKTGISESAIREFILYGEFMKDEDTVKEKRKGNGGMYISDEIYRISFDGAAEVNRLNDLDDALASVLIADPAVGSGAFPLGMMSEIVKSRENISAYLAITMKAIDKRYMYKNERSPYMLKLQTIRNSIFAVDIEPSAVDITQLRLWLYRMENKKSPIEYLRSVSKSILTKPYTLDIVFSDSISLIEKINKAENVLHNHYECVSACSTSDCYILKDILYTLGNAMEFDDEKQYKVINTGTIGRYIDRWGVSPMRYLKDKYLYPVVDKELFHETFPNSYGKKAKKKKIIIKGLTLLDGSFDFDGLVIPGKSTMMISAESDDDLKLIGAYVNCKLVIYYIKQRYSSSSYNGGINFTKDMINNLPWIDLHDIDKNQIIQHVNSIIDMKRRRSTADTSLIEALIDEIYYRNFNLSCEEIRIVEDNA